MLAPNQPTLNCPANNTPIAIPGGFKAIHTFSKGDAVLAASAKMGKNKIDMSWSTSNVNFSSGGDSRGSHSAMVYIAMDDMDLQDMICTMDQIFLLSNGKLTTASKLSPDHQLVNKEGKSVKIGMVSIGSYLGGIHHIATSAPWRGNPDGHLLLAAGVIVGDFMLQMYFDQLPAEMKDL